ncbi:MAG: hypothetical protein ACI4JD_01180 [Ruminococcus sp.]
MEEADRVILSQFRILCQYRTNAISKNLLTKRTEYDIIVLTVKDEIVMRSTQKKKSSGVAASELFVWDIVGLLPVYPLAYVVSGYTCHDRNGKR